ncbi:hypothetical protein CsatB_000063 [Cannabis sativa]
MAEEEKEKSQNLYYWGGDIEEQDYYTQQGIKGSSSFFTSPRGLKLFTRSWLPQNPNNPPRALIFMIHGYGNDISWTFQATPIFLAQNGYACFALDLQGHGRSDGLKAFVPSVDLVVEDCLSFFNFIKNQNPQFQKLGFEKIPNFLFGESMGGAISLLIHLSDQKGFDGAVLVAPMCRISEKLKPRWPIPQILTQFAKFFPTLAVVPTEDLMPKSVRVEEKKLVADRNPMRYRGKPRLGTVVELLRVTEYLSLRLKEVKIPLMVVHGSGDVVTDPQVSLALVEEAKSEDKCIKIYDGMMHSLLFGESDENVEIVRNDILSWLNHRSKNDSDSSSSSIIID